MKLRSAGHILGVLHHLGTWLMRYLAFLLFPGLALPASAQMQAEIRAVTLSTAGLALIEADGRLGPNPLRLQIRRAEIDDFLKSLRVSDPGAGTPMLTLAGPAATEDLFDALPFEASALRDLPALIDAMTGAPMIATRHGTTLSGVVMGTRDLPCASPEQRHCLALVLRSEDGTLRQIALDEATDLTFTEAADRAAIAQGLEALRVSARGHLLDIDLTSSGPDTRDVGLGWLQPAPIWKTAWRVEDGANGLRLTAWAVIENTTGYDWNDIELTLATGAVQALQASLYERQDASRAWRASADAVTLDMPQMAREMTFEAQMSPAEVTMDDGDSFSRFTLNTLVTLKAGQMISLPFLSEGLDEARLTVHHGGRGASHPMIAIAFENPLPLRLPAGIATFYEAGRGHAGDARIPELAPGARDVIEFARDTAMRIDDSVTEDTHIQSGRVIDGVLHATERAERRTRYRIEGAPDRDVVLTLLHPQRAGWDVDDPEGIAEFDATRFEVEVPAGEIITREIVESRAISQQIALLPLDRTELLYWSNQVTDPDIRQLLTAMQILRSEEADLRAQIARQTTQEQELIADQDRLAGLIVQLGGDSAATSSRRARVDELDHEIDAVRSARRAAETRLSEITAELRALVHDS